MKKIVISSILLATMGFYSCDKADVTQETKNANSLANRPVDPIKEFNAYSMHIDDGLSGECEKNILVFPSWANYYQTIEVLDNQVDATCDAFDATVPPETTDEEYDALALAAGFDEDNPLINFENNLSFCSLRRKLVALEDEWLFNQGDGEWDANADPDNHFIDDDTERTLLNEGVEVIIGDIKKGDQVIYKFTDDNGSYIEIHNMDVIALQQINSGIMPTGNPNVVVVDGVKPSTGDCKGNNDFRHYFEVNSNARMKSVDKYKPRSGVGNPRVKAKTKYYKKRAGRWITARTMISVKLVTDAGLQCGMGVMPEPKPQVGRKRKVKTKWNAIDLLSNNPEIIDNATYGIHKVREDLIKTIDLYDNEIQ